MNINYVDNIRFLADNLVGLKKEVLEELSDQDRKIIKISLEAKPGDQTIRRFSDDFRDRIQVLKDNNKYSGISLGIFMQIWEWCREKLGLTVLITHIPTKAINAQELSAMLKLSNSRSSGTLPINLREELLSNGYAPILCSVVLKDLSDYNIQSIDFSDIYFKDVTLTGIKFAECTFTDAIFDSCTFKDSLAFESCSFMKTTFSQCTYEPKDNNPLKITECDMNNLYMSVDPNPNSSYQIHISPKEGHPRKHNSVMEKRVYGDIPMKLQVSREDVRTFTKVI